MIFTPNLPPKYINALFIGFVGLTLTVQVPPPAYFNKAPKSVQSPEKSSNSGVFIFLEMFRKGTNITPNNEKFTPKITPKVTYSASA